MHSEKGLAPKLGISHALVMTNASKTFISIDRGMTYTDVVYQNGRVDSHAFGSQPYYWGTDVHGNEIVTTERVNSKSTRNVGKRLDLEKVAECRREMGWREIK